MFTPKEALEFGLVDHLVEGNTEAVLARAVEVGEVASANARHGVWGLIKVRLSLTQGESYSTIVYRATYIVMCWKLSKSTLVL